MAVKQFKQAPATWEDCKQLPEIRAGSVVRSPFVVRTLARTHARAHHHNHTSHAHTIDTPITHTNTPHTDAHTPLTHTLLLQHTTRGHSQAHNRHKTVCMGCKNQVNTTFSKRGLRGRAVA